MNRLLLCLLLAACGQGLDPQLSENSSSLTAPRVVLGEHPHVLPLRSGAQAAAAPAGAHLDYYGGHVIPNVRVIAVYWGSLVSSSTTSRIPGFYRSVTQSPYFDWLSEYDTTITARGGQAGTNQHIGRGSFGGAFTITPSLPAPVVTNSQIQTELAAQIAGGHLPQPDQNSLYMIYFAPGTQIVLEGGVNTAASCVQFCAFHNTFTLNGQSVYYGVMPDLTDGACLLGCGPISTDTFNNLTSVSSHELIEAVTDAEVGLATDYAPPLAWYDQTNGEIGDICNGTQGTVTGSDGATYTVQTEWSNVAGACITQR